MFFVIIISFTHFAPFHKSVRDWPQSLKKGKQRFQNFKTQGIALKKFRTLDLNPQNKILHPSCIQQILSERLYKLQVKDSKMHPKLQPNSSHLLHTATDTEGGLQACCSAWVRLWPFPHPLNLSWNCFIQKKKTVRQSHSHGQDVVV